nr:MAG TPA: hypothetical protein [Caudoviricetes sp.]
MPGKPRKIKSESTPVLYHFWYVLGKGRIFYTYFQGGNDIWLNV